MSDSRYGKWKCAAGEVVVFVVALVIAANITNLIVPVNLPASGVAAGEEAQRLHRSLTINYWVGVPVWLATYCLLHLAYRRWRDRRRTDRRAAAA